MIDSSLVEQYSSFGVPSVFSKISHDRRSIENINFAFIIVTLVVGIFSVVFENTLGISAYSISVVLNFVLGTSALLCFTFSLRYFFDLCLLYFALVMRSKLVFTFFPIQVTRH